MLELSEVSAVPEVSVGTKLAVDAQIQTELLLLMGMGLGAMYMLHLLAQDYNKIRQPVAAAARALATASNAVARVKRGNTEAITKVYKLLNIQEQPGSHNTANTTTLSIEWKRILSRDPFECLLSLICQLMSGAEAHSREARLIKEFLETKVTHAPAKIGRAFSRGLALQGATDRCYDEYPFCVYSAKTMLRVLRWFVESPSEEDA
ncbi:uncharacterized protein LOC118741550 [Rhagoletis pomonella]|uniref:uncharacterized protein LOC118741550 n=1 Tax=Rhagoletis pomonella TaxID=28610 RepID=UPI001786C3A4|nr:uncharacterized protein LOC118741550 [Rhagoletis pomonella]